MTSKRRVIVVTDGDTFAKRALRIAAKRIKARLISRSAGNPTPLSGVELANLIKMTPYDPVIVMLDDNGDKNEARGEEALHVLMSHPDIEVIGALAVASNTSLVKGVTVDFSIDATGERISSGVNKEGAPIPRTQVFGDTVDSLNEVEAPVIVGIGDIGKMGGNDAPERGAPVTTKALSLLLEAYQQVVRAKEPSQTQKRRHRV